VPDIFVKNIVSEISKNVKDFSRIGRPFIDKFAVPTGDLQVTANIAWECISAFMSPVSNDPFKVNHYFLRPKIMIETFTILKTHC